MSKMTNEERRKWNLMLREIEKLRKENTKLEQSKRSLDAIELAEEHGYSYYWCNETWFVVAEETTDSIDVKLLDWYDQQKEGK